MMTAVPISWFLTLSAILFALGVAGFLFRRNIITVFMSIELMLNAVNLSFVAFAYRWKQVDGQVFTFFVMVVAAAEAAVGLVQPSSGTVARFGRVGYVPEDRHRAGLMLTAEA